MPLDINAMSTFAAVCPAIPRYAKRLAAFCRVQYCAAIRAIIRIKHGLLCIAENVQLLLCRQRARFHRCFLPLVPTNIAPHRGQKLQTSTSEYPHAPQSYRHHRLFHCFTVFFGQSASSCSALKCPVVAADIKDSLLHIALTSFHVLDFAARTVASLVARP